MSRLRDDPFRSHDLRPDRWLDHPTPWFQQFEHLMSDRSDHPTRLLLRLNPRPRLMIRPTIMRLNSRPDEMIQVGQNFQTLEDLSNYYTLRPDLRQPVQKLDAPFIC